MADPVQQIVDELADIKRRLANLETSPQLSKSTVRAGYTVWKPGYDEGEVPPETPRVFIGSAGSGSGDQVGVYVVGDSWEDDGNGQVFVGTAAGMPTIRVDATEDGGAASFQIQNGVWTAPYLVAPWVIRTSGVIDTTGRPVSTSATFAEAYTCMTPCVSGGFYSLIDSFAGAAVMDTRIRAKIWGGTEEVTIADSLSQTGTTAIFGPWDVPTLDGLNPLGRFLQLTLEFRRVSGAVNVAVAPRFPMISWPT